MSSRVGGEMRGDVERRRERVRRRRRAERAAGDHPQRDAVALDLRQARARMMLERRLRVLVRDGQRDPRLDAVHRLAGRALFVGRALRMDDAAAGGHPVDVAGDDLLHASRGCRDA